MSHLKLNQKAIKQLAKAMNMPIKDGEIGCSGKCGYVYLKTDDGLKPIMLDHDTRKPVEVGCEHEAIEAVEYYINRLAQYIAEKIDDLDFSNMPDLPHPRDFVYVYAEDGPVVDDHDMATDDATALINSIKEKL